MSMRHPYHLIEPSPWPLLISFNLLSFLIGMVSYVSGQFYSLTTLKISLIVICYILYLWLIDISSESLYMGFHSYKVLNGFILGFYYFLLTEIMLFFSVFWGYFHSALNPFNLIWPPVGLDLINPWSIPLLNTFLLLYSGVAATYAHHSYLNNQRNTSFNWLFLSIILGIIFILFQIFEYNFSSYDISDSVYSSAFYLLTGLHFLHVSFGLAFLSVVLAKILNYHTPEITFNLSVLYWHFVDIVWIILFILIYYMGY